jgi:hypothetical protein
MIGFVSESDEIALSYESLAHLPLDPDSYESARKACNVAETHIKKMYKMLFTLNLILTLILTLNIEQSGLLVLSYLVGLCIFSLKFAEVSVRVRVRVGVRAGFRFRVTIRFRFKVS